MMDKLIIIHALLGDYSRVAAEIEKEADANGNTTHRCDTHTPDSCKRVCVRNAALEEENDLLKDELNELYLKYDLMTAAFGEINHLIKEAANLPARHFGGQQA